MVAVVESASREDHPPATRCTRSRRRLACFKTVRQLMNEWMVKGRYHSEVAFLPLHRVHKKNDARCIQTTDNTPIRRLSSIDWPRLHCARTPKSGCWPGQTDGSVHERRSGHARHTASCVDELIISMMAMVMIEDGEGERSSS